MKVSFGEFQAKVLGGESVALRYPSEDVPAEISEMAKALRAMARKSLSDGWTMDDIAELALSYGE